MDFKELQDKIISLDTSKKVNIKKGEGGQPDVKYISWADAWNDILKISPTANYAIKEWNGLPYLKTDEGILVQTEVEIEGFKRSMWLPVMNGANKAMKGEAYEYQTKSGARTVAAATMTDINRTIMRCLVKNLAMFGYGLNIYQGEDIPDVEDLNFVKQKVFCADCGCVIEDVQANGKIKKAEDIIKNTQSLYGRALCANCTIKEKNKREASKASANNESKEENE